MHIEFHKIHLAYQAHEKHTQDEMHLKNYLVALIKKKHFLKDQNCGEMWSIKTSVNLYRILEFTFRNIRQTIAYSTDSRTSKLPKGRGGAGAEGVLDQWQGELGN